MSTVVRTYPETRIPVLPHPLDEAGIREWFRLLSERGLLFHPDRDPGDAIQTVQTLDVGVPPFSPLEVLILRGCVYAIRQITDDPVALALTAWLDRARGKTHP